MSAQTAAAMQEAATDEQECLEAEEDIGAVRIAPAVMEKKISKARASTAEDSLIVSIPDAKNQATWHVYKVPCRQEAAGLLERICASLGKWSRNIRGWLSGSPEDEYAREGYTDPASEKYKKVMKNGHYVHDAALHTYVMLYHTFPESIDALVHEHGQSSSGLDRKTGRELYYASVPGDVELSDGSRQTGLFSFITDKETGKCFHRMFEPKKLNWQDEALYQVALSDEALAELMQLSPIQ